VHQATSYVTQPVDKPVLSLSHNSTWWVGFAASQAMQQHYASGEHRRIASRMSKFSAEAWCHMSGCNCVKGEVQKSKVRRLRRHCTCVMSCTRWVETLELGLLQPARQRMHCLPAQAVPADKQYRLANALPTGLCDALLADQSVTHWDHTMTPRPDEHVHTTVAHLHFCF
jgi:hypothetical protein